MSVILSNLDRVVELLSFLLGKLPKLMHLVLVDLLIGLRLDELLLCGPQLSFGSCITHHASILGTKDTEWLILRLKPRSETWQHHIPRLDPLLQHHCRVTRLHHASGRIGRFKHRRLPFLRQHRLVVHQARRGLGHNELIVWDGRRADGLPTGHEL